MTAKAKIYLVFLIVWTTLILSTDFNLWCYHGIFSALIFHLIASCFGLLILQHQIVWDAGADLAKWALNAAFNSEAP